VLKEKWRSISRIERLADLVIVVLSFFTAYYGRDSLIFWGELFGFHSLFAGEELAPISDYSVILISGLLFYATSLNFLGAYGSMRLSSPFKLLRLSLFSSLLVFIALSAMLFILKLDLSRVVVGMFCVLVGFALTAERYVVLSFLRHWRRRGFNYRNVIVCGTGEQAISLAKVIWSRPELGIRIRGFANLESDNFETRERVQEFKARLEDLAPERHVRVIAGSEGLTQVLSNWAIDEVIFTDVIQVMPLVQEVVLVCSEQGVRTTIAADFFNVGIIKSTMSYFGDMPLIHFQTPPGDRWELALKRWIDLFGSALLLFLLLPILLIIYLLIKLTTPGPAFFTQKRMGLNGRLFSLYKFRSMYVDAESKLAELQEKNEMKGPVFKIKDDPRITPVGSFLRRFSLDELPQLWNVLKGEMSLVGPRPPLPGEVSMYESRDRRRLSMRPGLTCIWQVSGRNEIQDFSTWVQMDLKYIDNWSLGRDLVLLFRTIPAVLFGAGAR